MNSKSYQVVVIGGGAAGFFGAIACAETHPDAIVTLLEASHRPLTKVLISGGGRCNVTHACFEPKLLIQHYPRGGKALLGPFSRFQPQTMVAWLRQRGVKLKTEADGRMFPITDDAATIANCLLHAAADAGVQVRLNAPVNAIAPTEAGFSVELKSGELIRCDRLLLATGSTPIGYRLAQSLGHSIEPPVPSLFTFNVPEPQLRDLAGVSIPEAHLRLGVVGHRPLEQTGPLLITHWGLSGPAVLKLSAWGARSLHDQRYQAELQINWIPDLSLQAIQQTMSDARSASPRKAIASTVLFGLPRRLWQYLVNRAGIDDEQRWANLSKKLTQSLVHELSQGTYAIRGKGVFKDEFVTCGGVNLKEVNFKTMESRCCPGLHLAGEILDIDGVTGGFNFQSAWTTAWLAGQAMGARSAPIQEGQRSPISRNFPE